MAICRLNKKTGGQLIREVFSSNSLQSGHVIVIIIKPERQMCVLIDQNPFFPFFCRSLYI